MIRLTLALILALLAPQAGAEQVQSATAVARAAQGADIVILGEVHDNPAHHRLQAEVVEALAPTALVFEMLTEDGARRVTPDLAADPVALEEVLMWSESGWPDFAMYYPLIAYAQTGPIYGAQVVREAAQGAFANGAAATFGAGAARFGLDRPLPEEEQAAREAAQLAAHCDALPPEILPGFVEAQRLRDAVLARVALDALARHGAPVAIITGNGHARRDWGIPALLAVAAPELEVVSLGQFEAPPDADTPFDLWALADPVARPDPCAAFR
ncbi:Lipoprotein, putative [Roseibacterium elongatum DSM 19469]|uniref:Lipoprotein, putative n=1 Tax=Roseicyclus elongatus DSM 19469 TaxID=1294273 RepID=W8S273_9RHOB|nr:ChaN family lipoprotein [Roseibacterium elongatum]AHM02841.1 Lipoprotein, putative [Roseibacterium elongatum DSM 19469]